MIHRELYKKLKFNLTNKWYMHNPESVLENETLKLLWCFDIQTDHLISARQLDLITINNNNNNNNKRELAELWNFLGKQGKMKESEKKDKYHDLARELKKCGT